MFLKTSRNWQKKLLQLLSVKLLFHSKIPPHLRKSISQSLLANDIYEKYVSRVGKEWELNGLKAPEERHVNTVLQQATKHKT